MTANDAFFQKKQAAAVLKHGILERYPAVFATMTGSTSAQGRVVYLDGYAGPGRYDPEDGEELGAPGSPLLAVQTATTVAKWSRLLHCVFVERNTQYAHNLRSVLEDEAPSSVSFDVLEGDLSERLDDALSIAKESPLLAFLDPFGTALPYDRMVDDLMRRRGQLKTEVLLNLNLEMVWRIGGFLSGDESDSERNTAGRSATLERVDNFLGGDWWRKTFKEARVEGATGAAAKAARIVASEYCAKVYSDTGYRSFSVPIRRRPNHPPLFLMVLFYRHSAAPYQFNESVSGANMAWREHFRQLDLEEELGKVRDEPDLFGSQLTVEMSEREAKAIEDQLDREWVETVSENIRKEIAKRSVLSVEADFSEIYGTSLGLARGKHLRRAWDQLADVGVIRPRDKSTTLRKLKIIRA